MEERWVLVWVNGKGWSWPGTMKRGKARILGID
jgi:hypothetical protein